MFKPDRYVNKVVGLVVMLLMTFALITGQADAADREAGIAASIEPRQSAADQFIITIAVVTHQCSVTDLDYMRGADE